MSLQICQTVPCGSLLKPIEEVKGGEGIAKAVSLSLLITELVEEALTAFINGDLARFDAPVGDNSCKIRASKIALLAENAPFKEEALQFLAVAKKIKERIISTSPLSVKEKISLLELRQKNEWEFPLSLDASFLVQSYLLFRVKKEKTYDQTDPALLAKRGKIAVSAAKDLIFFTKQQLAAASVEYVRSCISFCPEERREILHKMLGPSFEADEQGRKILPNLYCMEALLFRALFARQVLILKSSEDKTFAFQANEDKTSFVLLESPPLKVSAIVLEISSMDGGFLKGDLLPSLLIIAAQDPQYLDGEKAAPIPFEKGRNDPAIQKEELRFKALCKGVRVFTIKHIYQT